MLHNKISKICEQKLDFLNYSKCTKSIYIHYINEFLKTFNFDSSKINSDDFQTYLDSYTFSSVSKQNQVINAIRFLYKYGLNKKYDKVSFQRPRGEKKLPRIIESDFLLDKISKIKNIKHKSIISLAFSVGLRVSEIINLKIEHIDSKRMIINIIKGKGRKDRIVPLSENILILLRYYWKEYKPKEYLFNGQNSLKYSAKSCNNILKKLIGKEYHFHLLRHSCFTYLHENGTDIKIIKDVAGHQNIKTTEIYTHTSTKTLSKIKLPL